MAMWFDEVFEDNLRLGLQVESYAYRGKSDYQTIDIFDTIPFGRTLALGNTFQTSVGDEFLYHEMLVHPAMTRAPALANVLIIGGGDGGTVREVLRYPEVQKCTMVELDKMVVKACQDHLYEMNVPWDDPRLDVRFEDGLSFIKHCTESYDVILIDGPDPVGPAEVLYTNAFYGSCRDHLAPAGLFAAQVESPMVMRSDFVRIVKTLKNEFSVAEPYFGPVPIYPSGAWAFCLATRASALPEPLEERIARIEPRSRYWNREIQQAAFAQPNYVRESLR